MNTEYPDRYIDLGLKVAYYRKKAGFKTQKQFADAIGKSVSYVAKIEASNMVGGLSLEGLFNIADALSISPSKLLED
jgi:transcriptional regulator with XRE-family HTH domain